MDYVLSPKFQVRKLTWSMASQASVSEELMGWCIRIIREYIYALHEYKRRLALTFTQYIILRKNTIGTWLLCFVWFECSYVSLAWMRLCFITCYYDPKYFVLGMCSTAKFPKKDYLICRMREISVEVGSFGNCKPLTNYIIISYSTSQEFWTRFVLCCVWFCEFCY